MDNFTIEKHTRVDGFGKESLPYFVIRYQVKRMFRKPKWVYLKHTRPNYYGISTPEITFFTDIEKAQLVIDKYLSKGIMIPTTIKEIVK